MSRRPLWIPIFCTLLFCPAVLASPQVRLEPVVSHYHYREVSDSNHELNRETGVLYGGRLSLSGTLNPDWSWRLSAEELRGHLDYRGQTQAGAPLNTDTHLRHQQLHGILQRCLSDCQTRIHTGLAWHERERDIRPTANSLRLLERYQGWELGIGIRQQLLPERLWVLVEVNRTRATEVRADLREVGYGRPVIPLPDTWGFRAEATLALFEAPRLAGYLNLGYLYRRMEQSRSIQANRTGGGSATVLQPESELRQWETSLLLNWHY